MAKLGEAFVVINAKLGPLKNALSRAFNMVRRGVSRMAKIGVAGFAALAAAALKFASDAEETANLFSVSMGKMHSRALEFTKSYSDALGLDIVQMQEFMGIFNVMIKGMGVGAEMSSHMSAEFTKLAFDISSFRNSKPEEAFNKLRQGIAGETEGLKALGIVMTDTNLATFAAANGATKLWKEMSQAEKTILRYQFILSKTKDDQGDLARTGGSFANNLRKIRNELVKTLAAVGGVFLGDASMGLSALSKKIAETRPKLVAFFEDARMKALGFIDAHGGIGAIMDKIAGVFDTLSNVIKNTLVPLFKMILQMVLTLAKSMGIIKGTIMTTKSGTVRTIDASQNNQAFPFVGEHKTLQNSDKINRNFQEMIRLQRGIQSNTGGGIGA